MAHRAPFRFVWLVFFALLISLVPPGPLSQARQPENTANTADWPMPHYDFGRTRANLLELSLYPPFGPTPAQAVKYDAGEAVRPAAVVANDMLFWYDLISFGVGGELLVATDFSGQKIWGFDAMPGYNLTAAPPVVVGQEVFVLETGFDESYNPINNIVALDRVSGAFLWHRPTNWTSQQSGARDLPIAVQNGTAYLTWEDSDAHKGYITAVDARTGLEIWTTTVDNLGGATASALAITGDILLALHFTYLVAYDLATGAEMWEADTYAELGLVADVEDMLAVAGKVAVANRGRIAVYDAQTSSRIWKDDFDRSVCSPDSGLVMASDGDVLAVMGMCGNQLVTYNLATGAERWRVTAHRASGHYSIAIANGVLYTNGYDDQKDTDYIAAYALSSGQLLERIEVNSFAQSVYGSAFDGLAVANGRLYIAVQTPTLTSLFGGTLYAWGTGSSGSGDAYLSVFDDDGVADTNPDAAAEVSIIERDGAFGAEISVGAKIGGLPATLHVYHSDGQPYKAAVGNPDAHGNGFWVVPLEYAAGGYEYQVILADNTELTRRRIVMPADPAAAVDFVVQTAGLAWQSPPATITTAPHTLRLSLPPGFPAGATASYAVLQAPGIGMLTVAGERAAGEILIHLDEHNAVNGQFVVTAVARAGNVTAFSPDINLTVNAPALPDVRVDSITAIAPEPDGSATAAAFRFERTRPAVDAAQQVDAQIASVVPDPSGFQVTLWVRTPPEDALDPLTSKWEVGLSGRDAAGNELDRVTTEIPATPGGRYVVMGLTQPGTQPIATIAALGATLEGAAGSPALRLAATAAVACVPPDGKISSDKPLAVSDLVGVTFDLGVTGEVVAGAGGSTAYYVQGDAISGQVQACAEGGIRVGGGISAGPQVALGASLNLRGPGHTAPANSGRKFDVTVAAGVGIQFSYTVPDNFGDSGFGQIGVSVSAAPEVGISGGASVYTCWPPQNEKQPQNRCCTGANCGPTEPNPPPSPGGDHPDDTLSVVLQNESFGEDLIYWRNVAALANARGFAELAAYAQYRYRDFAYLEGIRGYPAGQSLNAAQQRTVRAYESNRLLTTVEMLSKRGIIAAQMAQIEALHANVLANGYYAEMRQMLSFHGIPNRLVSPDFSPDALTGSMLIIPTAGLYGLDADAALAARLERFVAQGGTLLVMSQPGADALDVLPGDWQQVDYQQDVSCYSDAMTISRYHPVLASAFESRLTAYVDGYMTAIPATADLLMQRTKNGQGAFVLYEHGQGRMLVTNMYDDWGRTVGQSSPQVRALFRDVVRWASIGGEALPDVRPGSPVSVNVRVGNVSDMQTNKVQWLVREPNGLLVSSGLSIRDLMLAPGESASQTVNFTPGAATLGIWSLNYQLLDAVDQVVQGETQASYFIVSNPPSGLSVAAQTDAASTPTAVGAAAPAPAAITSADVSLALSKAAYAPGENVQATLDIALSDPGSIGGLRVLVSLGETALEQEAAALVNQQMVFDLPADFSGGGLLFFGVYESTDGQGLYLNTRWVQRAGDVITIVPAAPTYAPGDTVTLNISGSYHGKVFVDGSDVARTIEVSGQGSAAFDLPTVLASGPVQVRYEDNGFQRTARFDVIGPRVTVTEMKTAQPIVAPGAEAEIVARIISDRPLDVRVTGRIVDGDGFVFPVTDAVQALPVGVQTLTLTVPISTTTSGSVRFEMAIADAAQTSVRYVEAHRYLTVDAPVLQAIRVAGGQLATNDPQQVLLDWYSPSPRTVDVTVWLDGTAVVTGAASPAGGFQTTSMNLPAGLAPGSYALFAQANLGDGLTTSAGSTLIVVKPRSMVVFLPLVVR